MKQVDATIVKIKDALRLTPSIKPSATAGTTKPTTVVPPKAKISQQDVLKQRAETLKKELETLRAKTSADMVKTLQSFF